MQQYFLLTNPDYGEWAPRPGAFAKVMQRIKPATYVLEPGEYADKLPPLHVVHVPCEIADRKPYEEMKKNLVVALGGATVTAVNAAVMTGKLAQMSSGFVYDTVVTASDTPGKWDTVQKPVWFSSHKFDALEDLLAENQRDNTLLVYNFKEELAELKRRYPQAQTLDDADAVDRWNAGKIELLAVHPKSAGHGLNLQFGGNKIVFLSLPWSRELYEQVVGRLHRGGQTREVWCYVMETLKTIDQRIWGSLEDKKALSDIVMEELK